MKALDDKYCTAAFGQRTAVAFVSLGCRVNRVETDAIASALVEAGSVVVGEDEADAIVINTCAVTGEAEAKTRKAVRHAAALPQRPLVVATGCVANLFADELRALGDRVVVEADKTRVANVVLAALENAKTSNSYSGSVPRAGSVTPTGRTRPGIKIQDGCDLRCTYCIVWMARGASRSVAPEEVGRLVRQACAEGAREVVLTGINLGRYRAHDEDGHPFALPELLEYLLRETEVGRLRLGSIEPQDVDLRLGKLIAESEGRVAPFLHMCLQAGSDATLARMGRVYDTALFAERMAQVRSVLPLASFGTDLIVGFPGESEADFEESLSFCRDARFSRMHVFRYSKRPGTPAATMDGQVPAPVAAERAARVHKLARELRLAEARGLVGERDRVVVQASGRGVSGGLFDAELDRSLPIDTLVDVRVVDVRPDATLVCETLG